MRVYFRVDDIDNVDYDANGYQAKPTQPTNDVIRGVANIDRSQLTFRNINLMTILGYQRVNQGGTFNIKVVDVRAINENGQNVIDYDSPAQLRTSNVFLSGLTFFNGKNENYLCPFTNFNPNEELVFENVYFSRGDQVDYQHIYNYNQANEGGTTNDFYRLMSQEVATTANTSLTRFRFDATPTASVASNISVLNGKIMRAGRAERLNAVAFRITVQDANDGSLPIRVTDTGIAGGNAQQNGICKITVLPENNQWFHRRYTDNVHEDDFNNELTAYIPSSHIVDLKFELRDILTNTLQPVIAEPNGKVYPSIEFVLDIY